MIDWLPVYFFHMFDEGIIPSVLGLGWIKRDDAIKSGVTINPNESVSLGSIAKDKAWIFEIAERYNIKFVTAL
jgi:hypothetical protein